MRAIPDLMTNLSEVTSGSLRQIRKTAEDPPRVSILDVLSVVTGTSQQNCNAVWQRLQENFPEVTIQSCNFQFSGRGQRPTPVTDARGIVEVIMVLPGRAAGRVRKQAADVLVRYLGGDPALVQEIAANRLIQEELDDDDPARLFGQAVESEALKRKREDVEICEPDGRFKKARLQAATEVARLTLSSLQDLGLPISDRDRMLCKDMICNAGICADKAITDAEDRDICLQHFCAENGKRSQHVQLGKKAKKLYLDAHPGFEFQKKDALCNGQIIPVNRWTESMRPWLQKAIEQM